MEICTHNEYCGGCIYQEMPYSAQLAYKGSEVLRLLQEKGIDIGDLLTPENEETISPEKIIAPAPCIYRYRNKMEYTFGDQVKGGEMTLGMHQKGRFMSIVTVDECQLVDEDFNTALKATLAFCKEHGYRFYNKKAHKGLLRNLIVRKGERTNELLINLVTSSQDEFDANAYCEMLLALDLHNTIVGILRTINDRIADAVYCDALHVLYGRDYYTEHIMGLAFQVSAFSFFQTNVPAAERLYKDAIAMIDDVKDKVVFDLFCGTGTITQSVAAMEAQKAIGIELVEEAVEAAKINAARNNLTNCEFIAGDVFKILDTVQEKPDVIIVDPPRMGILPKALDKILAYKTKQILYISCNPKTLADNLRYMAYYGYEPVKFRAYDNFPMTKHVECVTLMSRVKE